MPQMRPQPGGVVAVASGSIALAVITGAFRAFWPAPNATIVALTFLLVVLVVAALAARWAAVTISLISMLAFNFFFLPPVGALSIADPQNWVALFTFLAVSLVASHLSAVARSRTREAEERRDELGRLFDVSREVLMITDGRQATSILARSITRRFDLEFVAIALPRGDAWDVFEAGAVTVALDPRRLSGIFSASHANLEFDAYARTYTGRTTIEVDGRTIRVVPLRVGTKPTGLLAASGRPIEAGTLDALGGIVAIAIERAQFLDERKTGEMTRQSEELKTALLASLGHDLRTPLTAIRVAAGNVQSASMTEADRREQSEIILIEVERLTRLFQNILEMARIDAGAVATKARWVHPSEIVAAARDQVEQALREHHVDVHVDPDLPVRLDPRLTATAVAHVLENAAQYAPAGSTIKVGASMTGEALTIQVRDEGLGISAKDLPRLFERFYRGDGAKTHASGTGMGLWIARGLLAVDGGRLWADNSPDGGALFTIVVPAAVRHDEPAEVPAL